MITIQSGKMIIPEEERFVGFAGDDRISTKQFILPQTQITDIDTVFSLYLRFDDDRVTSAPLNISIVDSDTILTWNVRAENLLKSGIVMAQIKYTNGEGCVTHYGWDYFVVGDISERGDDGEEYDILSRTEFEERMAQAVRDARATAPYIGEDGYWYIYSREQGDYVRSFSASGIPVDSEISGNSTNPIENRAVKQYVDACDSTKVDKTTCVAGVALNSGVTADDLYEGLADTINPPTVTIGTTRGYPAQYGKTVEGAPVFCTGLNSWKTLAKTEDIPTKISELINDSGFLNAADIKNHLHYVPVTSEEASSTYHKLLANLTPNSYSYVISDWFFDAPPNTTGVTWIFTIIPSSSSSFGMQIWVKPTTNIAYIRRKVKQADGNTYDWGEWTSVSDTSLSVEGAFADAKAVGDALAQKVGLNSLRSYLHYVDVTESSASSDYQSLLTNLTPNSYSLVSALWFEDAPTTGGGAWIYYFTQYSTSAVGMQIWFTPSSGVCFTRRKSTNGWGAWTSVSDTSLSVEGAFADAKAVGDAFATSIKYKGASPSDYNNTLSNIEKNTCSYVTGSSWDDAPVTSVGLIITTKTDANNFGSQIWISNYPASGNGYSGVYIRRFSSSQWTNWFSLADSTLSFEGAFAEAKAVGDALAQKVGIADMVPYLHYEAVSAPEEGTTYSLGDRTPNSYSYVVPTWFSDAPPTSVGVVWVFTIIPRSTSSYGVQFWFEPSTNACLMRRKTTSGWNKWVRLDDAYDSDRTYFAFGDSLVKGQIGRWTGGTHFSTRGYPDTTATMLHMTLNNQAVGGQGLIKDWALIVDTINALDMSNAGLITVGWSGNDGAVYKLAGLARGSYTDVTTVDVTDPDAVKALVTYDSDGFPAPDGFGTTVMGYYFTIMKLLQTKCPHAQIVLVTGYGHGGGSRQSQLLPTFEEQFTAFRTFGSGPSCTFKEMFDELEKMANLHGWGCVNQAKGCAFNEFNAQYLFGDHAHPTDDGYAKYGNNLAPRIAAFYGNRNLS